MDTENFSRIGSYDVMIKGVKTDDYESEDLVRFDKDYSALKDETKKSFEEGDIAKLYSKDGRLYIIDRNGIELDFANNKLDYCTANLKQSRKQTKGIMLELETNVGNVYACVFIDPEYNLKMGLDSEYNSIRLFEAKRPINDTDKKYIPPELKDFDVEQYTAYREFKKVVKEGANVRTKELENNRPTAEFIDKFLETAKPILEKEIKKLDKLYKDIEDGDVVRYDKKELKYSKS